MGDLTLVTAPAIEPVTLVQAKQQLRVEVDDDNALITALIKAAREHVETFTRRALIAQTWDLKLDVFPCDRVELPLAPVSAVSSIAYLDTAGVSQTWSSSYYRSVLFSGPKARRSYIEPAYGYTYPSTQAVSAAVSVRFVAGYGTDASSVPEALKAAVKLIVAHLYSNRGADAAPLPPAVDALLWPYRSF